MKKLLPALLMLLLLASCRDKAPAMHTVKVKNQYSLDLPEFLTKSASLQNDASLQYSSAEKELYVVVVDENKAEFNASVIENKDLGYKPTINGFAALGLDHMAKSTAFKGSPSLKTTIINGLPARIIAISGTAKSLNGYWNEAYIEGADAYYHIVTWTTEARKEEHQKTMQGIINSFKELHKNINRQ